nr:nucleoside triphosphate pyrophosphohydrolase [Sansalvadorimonas sp. 2012CJ34-2]
MNVMARLRDPQAGCPWDIEQTFKTIAPYTLEEAYEVVDAIERNDIDHLCEELGDLLLQVVFHARMAEEEKSFDFSDVVNAIVTKLLRRHPHVFPNASLADLQLKESPDLTPEEVRIKWQAIKAEEKAEEKAAKPVQDSLLDAVPNNLPALMIAQKLQDKAAKVNFDWPDVRPVLAKLREELDEIEEALDKGEQEEIAAEVGDFLFAATNLARHLDVDAEQSVRGCNQKFRNRFSYIERAVKAQGRDINKCTLEELDALWDEAKLKNY